MVILHLNPLLKSQTFSFRCPLHFFPTLIQGPVSSFPMSGAPAVPQGSTVPTTRFGVKAWSKARNGTWKPFIICCWSLALPLVEFLYYIYIIYICLYHFCVNIRKDDDYPSEKVATRFNPRFVLDGNGSRFGDVYRCLEILHPPSPKYGSFFCRV